eukprot:UN04247
MRVGFIEQERNLYFNEESLGLVLSVGVSKSRLKSRSSLFHINLKSSAAEMFNLGNKRFLYLQSTLRRLCSSKFKMEIQSIKTSVYVRLRPVAK